MRFRTAGLVAVLVCLVSLLLLGVFFTRGAPPQPAASVAVAAAVDPAPVPSAPPTLTAPHAKHSLVGVLLLGGLGLTAALWASSTFGAASGEWDQASLWSNGVPTSTVSAIVSSVSGIPILPYKTSAITKNISGGGTIGLCGGNLNRLVVVTPSASYPMLFCSVDNVEANSATSNTPRGHG